jgi:hypothetical protein
MLPIVILPGAETIGGLATGPETQWTTHGSRCTPYLDNNEYMHLTIEKIAVAGIHLK